MSDRIAYCGCGTLDAWIQIRATGPARRCSRSTRPAGSTRSTGGSAPARRTGSSSAARPQSASASSPRTISAGRSPANRWTEALTCPPSSGSWATPAPVPRRSTTSLLVRAGQEGLASTTGSVRDRIYPRVDTHSDGLDGNDSSLPGWRVLLPHPDLGVWVEPPVGIEPTTFSLRGGTTTPHLARTSNFAIILFAPRPHSPHELTPRRTTARTTPTVGADPRRHASR